VDGKYFVKRHKVKSVTSCIRKSKRQSIAN